MWSSRARIQFNNKLALAYSQSWGWRDHRNLMSRQNPLVYVVVKRILSQHSPSAPHDIMQCWNVMRGSERACICLAMKFNSALLWLIGISVASIYVLIACSKVSIDFKSCKRLSFEILSTWFSSKNLLCLRNLFRFIDS